MASAQLGKHLVTVSGPASREKVIPGAATPVLPAAPARPLPAPPVPVPPAAPGVPERPTVVPARRPAPARKVNDAGVAHPSVQVGQLARLIVAVIMTLIVVGGLSWLGQATNPGIPERTSMIRVGAGETVWDVASRVAPRSDQRAVVERIRQLNGMRDAAVWPDQQLLVPDGR